ncbi:MAG: hypothetical protein R2862_04390 [Thermoanaerobaculia bacterium]
MKGRTLLFALFAGALAAGAVAVAGRLLAAGRPDELRVALVWACRRSSSLAATSLFRSAAPAPARARGRVLFWLAAAVAGELLPLGLALVAGWATLAEGDSALAAHRGSTLLWALPLLLFVGYRFWERTLRGQLYEQAAAGFGERAAWSLAVVSGTLLALPAIAPGLASPSRAYLVAALLLAVSREALTTALYRGCGLLGAGLYRGLFACLDGYLLNDWLAPVVPGTTYLVASDAVRFLRVAGPAAVALLLVHSLRRSPATPGA